MDNQSGIDSAGLDRSQNLVEGYFHVFKVGLEELESQEGRSTHPGDSDPFRRQRIQIKGRFRNQNRPVTDFLMTFTEYTVLVEIKRPGTAIFRQAKGGRAGTWEFTSDFTSAVSQILEQKAEWSSFAETGEHYDKATGQRLTARTRNARCILVIGSRAEFEGSVNERAANLKRDTFELFRRECRSIDIVTFDELLERAQFITRSEERKASLVERGDV